MIPQALQDQINAVQADQDQLVKSKTVADQAASAANQANDAVKAADQQVTADAAHRDADRKALHAMIDQLYGETP